MCFKFAKGTEFCYLLTCQIEKETSIRVFDLLPALLQPPPPVNKPRQKKGVADLF